MMSVLGLSLALALTAPPLRAEDASADWEARLTKASGEVTVYTPEAPEGLPAEDGMPLEAGDRISTGEDGSAEVVLGEGAHIFSLRNSSEFTLTTVKKDAAELKLTMGSLLAKISKLAGAQRLSVRTAAAVAAVRGTEFGVELPADKPEETVVGVFDEGKVEVSGEGEAKEVLISNQETTVLRGRPPMQAYGLKRLMRHRKHIRGFKARGAYLRSHWKAIPPGQRKALRGKAMERMGQRKLKRLERMKGGRRMGPKAPSQRQLENKKKMERVREGFRKGGRRNP